MAKQKEEKHKECGKTKRKETRKEQNRTVGSDMNCRTVKLFAVEKEDGVVRSTLQHVTKCSAEDETEDGGHNGGEEDEHLQSWGCP